MALYQVQHSIPYYTGIPEDVVTNVLHFTFSDIDPPEPADFTDLSVLIKAFVTSWYGGISPNTSTMSKYARPALARQKMYNLDDPKPRVPVFDQVVPLTGVNQDATTTSVPPEAATCLSLKATYIGGVSKASQRGRIFIGALGNGWITPGDANSFPVTNSLCRTQATQGAINFKAAALAIGWTWVVYSPTTGDVFNITGGWMDNALDTQRRRGQAATSRTLWP